MYANAMGRMRIKSETQKARRPRSLCFQGISGTSPTSTMTRDTPLKQTRRPVSTRPFISPRLCFSSPYPYFFHFPPFPFFPRTTPSERSFLFAIFFFNSSKNFLSIPSLPPLRFYIFGNLFTYRFRRLQGLKGCALGCHGWLNAALAGNCVSYRAPCRSAVSAVIRDGQPLPAFLPSFLRTSFIDIHRRFRSPLHSACRTSPSTLAVALPPPLFFFLVSPAAPAFFSVLEYKERSGRRAEDARKIRRLRLRFAVGAGRVGGQGDENLPRRRDRVRPLDGVSFELLPSTKFLAMISRCLLPSFIYINKSLRGEQVSIVFADLSALRSITRIRILASNYI